MQRKLAKIKKNLVIMTDFYRIYKHCWKGASVGDMEVEPELALDDGEGGMA